MEENGKKIIAWFVLIAFASFLMWALLSMFTRVVEVNKVIKNIEKAETFVEVIEVYDDFVSDFSEEQAVKDEFNKVSFKYFEKNIENLNAVFLPYNISKENTKINSDYKGVVLYIKDVQNVYIFPNKIMWQVKDGDFGSKNFLFNDSYYDFEKNIVKLENIPNVNSYKYSIDYSYVIKGSLYGNGYEKLDRICYYLNSADAGKRISLQIDQYNNISLYDSKGTLFSYDEYTTRHHYVNILKMLDFQRKIDTEINIYTPEIRVKDSAILFTYNIGNNKELADELFTKYQNYLEQYYRISIKNDMVYVYAEDDIIACAKCGHEDSGYFMMLSFNYSDKIRYINSNSTTNSKSNSYKSSKGCRYKFSNGSTCGASVGSHSPLCDYHFHKLDSTYKYYTGY